MTKDELIEAIKSGRVTDAEDDWETEYIQSNPTRLADALWNRQDIRLDDEPIHVLEYTELGEDRGYGHDGQPMKVVWEIGGTHFVAIGMYNSWDGENFEDGWHEAELVNVPTWLPKKD